MKHDVLALASGPKRSTRFETVCGFRFIGMPCLCEIAVDGFKNYLQKAVT